MSYGGHCVLRGAEPFRKMIRSEKGFLLAERLDARCRVVAIVLSVLLICSSWGFAVSPAWADEIDDAQAAVDDAQAVLDSAEAQMSQISAEYDAIAEEIERLQGEIDESASEVMVAQAAMLEGRASLGQAAKYEYRGGAVASMLTLLLESTDFSELLRNMEYLSQVMDYQASEIEAQRERKAQFEEISARLTQQKDEQEQALAELEDKRAQAQSVVDDASAKLVDAQDEQAARLDALRQQAASFEAEQVQGGGGIAEGANTVDREEVVPDSTPVEPNPDNGTSGGGASDGGGAGSDASASGWLTGVASAYGGSSDPYTPNPGTTATGAVCDDWSMGVAIPMSMPNYSSYFGRTVEISYGGMTVYAVVNDCGSMGGGSRALDLQPGVFKAFGFSDCYAWGVRTVSYRFL